MRAARAVAALLLALYFVAVVALFLLGVWNVGGHEREWIGTAFVLFVAGVPVGAVAVTFIAGDLG